MLSPRKILFASIITVFSLTSTNAQDSISLESKAIAYFSDNVLKVDQQLRTLKLKFPNLTQPNPSEVYYLAYALGEINTIKGIVPNRQYLDHIDSANNKDTLLHVRKRFNLKIRKYKGTADGRPYEMFVYNSIPYKDAAYVELLLLDRPMGKSIYIFVKFINGEATGYYKKSLLYD
jgi:hypothetical protein